MIWSDLLFGKNRGSRGGRRARRSAGRKRRTLGENRLSFEWLEDRRVLSAAPAALLAMPVSSLARQSVTQQATTTTLSASANPGVSGQLVWLTADVTAAGTTTTTNAATATGAGGPGGLVDFVIGNKTIGPLPAQHAVIPWVFNAANSPYTIQANYLGNANYLPSSATTTETVNPAASAIHVLAPTTQPYGRPLNLTIIVGAKLPNVALPTAAATVTVDGGTPATVPLNKLGTGSFTVPVSELGVGSHAIVVSYPGDSNLGASSTTLNETITAATPQTVLTVSPQTSTLGKSVTLTAVVGLAQPFVSLPGGSSSSSQAALPTGTVTFYDDGKALNTTPVASSTTSTTGSATFTLSTALPTTGWQFITAVFTSSGANQADYNNSTSQVALARVVAASTTNPTSTGSSQTTKASAVANDLALMDLMNE